MGGFFCAFMSRCVPGGYKSGVRAALSGENCHFSSRWLVCGALHKLGLATRRAKDFFHRSHTENKVGLLSFIEPFELILELLTSGSQGHFDFIRASKQEFSTKLKGFTLLLRSKTLSQVL